MGERLASRTDSHPLASLLGKTSLLKVDSEGRIFAPEKIDVPRDGYGIPRRVQFMRNVLDTVAVGHYWTGISDIHHIAWPREDYRAVHDEDGEWWLGSLYRGSSQLRVYLPRQMHDYIHVISNPPKSPSIDVMRQYVLEQGNIMSLYDTIKLSSYAKFPELSALPNHVKEQMRHKRYLEKLGVMQEGQLGIQPKLEVLAKLELIEARQVLKSLLRVQGMQRAHGRRRRMHLAAAA